MKIGPTTKRRLDLVQNMSKGKVYSVFSTKHKPWSIQKSFIPQYTPSLLSTRFSFSCYNSGEEIVYFPSMKKEFTKDDETSDKLTMKGESKGMDKEFWETMTTGTGPLVAGALPGLDVQSEKAMADSLAGGSAKAPKAKAKPRDPAGAVSVEVATPKEYLDLKTQLMCLPLCSKGYIENSCNACDLRIISLTFCPGKLKTAKMMFSKRVLKRVVSLSA